MSKTDLIADSPGVKYQQQAWNYLFLMSKTVLIADSPGVKYQQQAWNYFFFFQGKATLFLEQVKFLRAPIPVDRAPGQKKSKKAAWRSLNYERCTTKLTMLFFLQHLPEYVERYPTDERSSTKVTHAVRASYSPIQGSLGKFSLFPFWLKSGNIPLGLAGMWFSTPCSLRSLGSFPGSLLFLKAPPYVTDPSSRLSLFRPDVSPVLSEWCQALQPPQVLLLPSAANSYKVPWPAVDFTKLFLT